MPVAHQENGPHPPSPLRGMTAKDAAKNIGTLFVGIARHRIATLGIVRFVATVGIGANGIARGATSVPMGCRYRVSGVGKMTNLKTSSTWKQ